MIGGRLFVGREPEVQRLGQLLDGAAAGRGGALLVSGEPGIGKTRFLQAASEAAIASDFAVASASNFEHARGALGPLSDCLRQLVDHQPDALPTLARDRSAVLQVLGLSEVPAPPLDGRRLLVVMLETLTRLATRKPWMIVIDDAQWSDPETLDFFTYAVPRLHNISGLFVLGLRSSTTDDAATLRRIAALSPVAHCELDGLGERESRTLVATLLPSGTRLSQPMVDAITTRSEGSPFIIESLTREALRSSGTLDATNLRSLVLERMRRLDKNAQRVVEAASAIGRRFDVQTLASITRQEQADVVAALRAAKDADIVVEVPADPRRFAFRHELLRTTIYNELLAIERERLHLRIAEALESAGAEPGLLSLHYLCAGEREKGAIAAEAAGDAAAARNAIASARDRYLEAESAGVFTAGDLARLQSKLGHMFDLLGDSTNAATRLAAAAEHSHSLGDHAAAAALNLRFANAAYRAGHIDDAIAACRSVIEMASVEETQFSGRALLAMFRAFGDDLVGAAEEIAEAEPLRRPDGAMERIPLEYAKLAVLRYDDGDQWAVPARAAIRIAEDANDLSMLIHALINYGMVCAERGDADEGEQALRRAAAIADENGRLYASAYARCALIHLLSFAGRLDEAYGFAFAVSASHVDAALVRLYLVEVALPVLADVGRLSQLSTLADPGLAAEAETSDAPWRFAAIVAAQLYASQVSDGVIDDNVIERALASVGAAAHLDAALLTYARLASARHLPRIGELLLSVPRAPGQVRVYRRATEAVLAARMKDQRAPRLLQSALEESDRIGAPMIAAQILEWMGRPSDALERYGKCGARAHVARLRGESSGSLTPREAEIAELIVGGHSNRAIAETLVLSERTVEHHVASILKKFNVRRRVELRVQLSRRSRTEFPQSNP
jgi:DNA-binding CsgD family transcriptional regulator